MKQYCRYCANALDYNGEAEDFICTANAECGNNGAGRMYSASKAKRINKCKHFDFNPLDVFYTTYGPREYKPRKLSLLPWEDESEQLTWSTLPPVSDDEEELKQQAKLFMEYAKGK